MVERAVVEDDEVSENAKAATRRWGFWDRHIISNGVTVYIDRISLITTPWFSIKLHRIYRPDEQRELHDHPWTFLSIVLWGSYVEDVPCRGCDRHYDDGHNAKRKIRWWNWKRAEDSHSIRKVSRSPVWTLVFTGRRRRIWGFYTRDGWVAWNEYDKLNEA